MISRFLKIFFTFIDLSFKLIDVFLTGEIKFKIPRANQNKNFLGCYAGNY